MMDFNKKLEHLSGLTGNEFVFGVVAYTALAVAIYVAVQVAIFVLSGDITSSIASGGYSLYPVQQQVAYYPNAITEYINSIGVI